MDNNPTYSNNLSFVPGFEKYFISIFQKEKSLMLGTTNKQYVEEIIGFKQQLLTATDFQEMEDLYTHIYNRYVRMGMLLEAEKITLDHLALIRSKKPKSEYVIHELRLSKLLIDNGKIQQGIDHLAYARNLCDIDEANEKVEYLSRLMGLYQVLSIRDKKYIPQHKEYLYQYEHTVKPITTLDKLNYYMELAGEYFFLDDREKGLAYKKKLVDLLENTIHFTDKHEDDEAYRDRYKNYLAQISVAELRNDPDPQKYISHALSILEKNKKEKFLPTAGVVYWLRNLARVYKKTNDIEGLKYTFDELQSTINEYVEESVDIKIYEQKYQSDYFLQEQKLEDAEQLNKVKDSVFSNFNHELRTPLNIILSNCELLPRDVKMPETGMKRLAVIQNQSYNLLNIIDQFIEINKTNLQFNKVNNEVGDLIQFLQLVETDFSTLGEQKDIALSFDVGKTKKLICQLDFAKLERILYNLLTNAIKFTPNNGKVSLQLKINRESKTVILIVADNGIGIAEKELRTIFEQFYSAKSDNENIKASTGFGIGLYLVHQLVSLLEGTITVESQLGSGSTFKISLPLLEYKGQSKQSKISKRLNYKHVKIAPAPSEIKPKNSAAPIDRNKPQLLVVEDNTDLLEIISASLQPHYNITTAKDGIEAKELLQTMLPELVITDLMMPRMNGIELTSHIKSTAALSHLPVVMLTAKGSLPNRIKGWEAGIDVFLRKPFAIAELEHCIHNIMLTRTRTQQRIELLLADSSIKSNTETPAEKFVNEFKQYVLTHINALDIHNADIAHHLKMDENSMYRKVKSLTGYTPVQLVTKLKILRAKAFIEAKQFTTLKEVAYNCGFNDPKYFSKVYKAETGVLPKLVKN